MGQVTDNIARLFRQAGVTTHIRPHNTIHSWLVHLKDKVQRVEKLSLVYHVCCTGCQATYIGETEPPLGIRLKEHQKRVPKAEDIWVSIIINFCSGSCHSHMQREGGIPAWRSRRHLDCQGNLSLNSDRGSYTLPPVYNQLLLSRDTHITQGSRDNTITADNRQAELESTKN